MFYVDLDKNIEETNVVVHSHLIFILRKNKLMHPWRPLKDFDVVVSCCAVFVFALMQIHSSEI